LGWIHTSSKEAKELNPFDVATHTKLLSENPMWDIETSVVINCGFPSGCCSLTGFKLTSAGIILT
jgi:hypothetical protein